MVKWGCEWEEKWDFVCVFRAAAGGFFPVAGGVGFCKCGVAGGWDFAGAGDCGAGGEVFGGWGEEVLPGVVFLYVDLFAGGADVAAGGVEGVRLFFGDLLAEGFEVGVDPFEDGDELWVGMWEDFWGEG